MDYNGALRDCHGRKPAPPPGPTHTHRAGGYLCGSKHNASITPAGSQSKQFIYLDSSYDRLHFRTGEGCCTHRKGAEVGVTARHFSAPCQDSILKVHGTDLHPARIALALSFQAKYHMLPYALARSKAVLHQRTAGTHRCKVSMLETSP